MRSLGPIGFKDLDQYGGMSEGGASVSTRVGLCCGCRISRGIWLAVDMERLRPVTPAEAVSLGNVAEEGIEPLDTYDGITATLGEWRD